MVDRQAMTHGFFGVVLALYQVFAGDIVFTFNFRRVVDGVVHAARGLVNATACDTLDDFFVFHRDFNHGIQLDTSRHQGFGLRNGARETVEQETVGTVRLRDTVLDQGNDQVIGNQATGVHDALGLNAQLGACFYRSAQHVTGGDLWNAEFFSDELCLSTFTGPGSSQQNDAHRCAPQFFIEMTLGFAAWGQSRKNVIRAAQTAKG